MVHLAKHLLERDGIECLVRGEHLAAAAGGVAPIDAWVELWVVHDIRVHEAMGLISEMLEESDDADDAWICPLCIEWREGQYSHCWQCGAERLS
jgi:hypothetical protein